MGLKMIKQRQKQARNDKGKMHAVKHGVLSRHILEALQHLGMDVKYFRKLENQFRKEMQPPGKVGAIFFDRFWSSYLRTALIARMESLTLAKMNLTGKLAGEEEAEGAEKTKIITLPLAGTQQTVAGDRFMEGFRQLALAQRYEAYYSREMHRALGLLMVLRDGGEAGLTESIKSLLGLRSPGNIGEGK